jgi:hypothetical protein
MICSSVNFDRFMVRSSLGPDSSIRWRSYRGSEQEDLHNSWDKNDPKDAQVILHMLEIGAVQFFHDPLAAGTSDIQELSKTHDIVSRSKSELWHRILTHYLPLYFPEDLSLTSRGGSLLTS